MTVRDNVLNFFKKKYERYKVVSSSIGAINKLRQYEFKILRCFGSEEFNENYVEEQLALISDEHMEIFLIRQLNYVEDAGTILDFGIEHSIQERNEKMAYVLEKYIRHFTNQINLLSNEEKSKLCENITKKQCPKVLEQTVKQVFSKL